MPDINLDTLRVRVSLAAPIAPSANRAARQDGRPGDSGEDHLPARFRETVEAIRAARGIVADLRAGRSGNRSPDSGTTVVQAVDAEGISTDEAEHAS